MGRNGAVFVLPQLGSRTVFFVMGTPYYVRGKSDLKVSFIQRTVLF
jgi:hypothetical protein